jgi:hypothetical protein
LFALDEHMRGADRRHDVSIVEHPCAREVLNDPPVVEAVANEYFRCNYRRKVAGHTGGSADSKTP